MDTFWNRRRQKGQKLEKKKRLVKDRIFRDTGTLFERENDNYYKLKRLSNLSKTIILNMKVMVIEIKTYH